MKIPAKIYEVFCPRCGSRIEYPLFMASFYDFATYQETRTKKVVRVDLEGVHHLKTTSDELLKKYAEKKLIKAESCEWINLKEKKFCQKCSAYFFEWRGWRR